MGDSRTRVPALGTLKGDIGPYKGAPAPTPPPSAGPITELERAVMGTLKIYDSLKEPAQALRDLAIRVGFNALRVLYKKRRK
jgi:hypothetical protein